MLFRIELASLDIASQIGEYLVPNFESARMKIAVKKFPWKNIFNTITQKIWKVRERNFRKKCW